MQDYSENKVGAECMDVSERIEPETEPVAPVVPRHPKSYMEIMEMIQRGERPDDIQACLNSSCLPLKLPQEKSVVSFFYELSLLWYRILMMTLQTLINQSQNPVWHRNPSHGKSKVKKVRPGI